MKSVSTNIIQLIGYLLVISFTLNSCKITKRVHLPGYFVETKLHKNTSLWSKKQNHNKTYNSLLETTVTPSAFSTDSANVSASNFKSINYPAKEVLIKKSPNIFSIDTSSYKKDKQINKDTINPKNNLIKTINVASGVSALSGILMMNFFAVILLGPIVYIIGAALLVLAFILSALAVRANDKTPFKGSKIGKTVYKMTRLLFIVAGVFFIIASVYALATAPLFGIGFVLFCLALGLFSFLLVKIGMILSKSKNNDQTFK